MTEPVKKHDYEVRDCLQKAMAAANLDDCRKHIQEAMKHLEEANGEKVGKTETPPETTPVAKSKFSVTADAEGAKWELDFQFQKLDEEGLVGGLVYEPDVEDSQGDAANADEIRKAAHNFLAESKTLGIMHKEAAGPRAEIVECAIAHDVFRMGNQTIRKGSWFMVVRIKDPELKADVKSGKITGFSMGGRARYAK